MGFATVGLVHAWFFLNFAVHNSANLEWRTLGVVFLLFVAAWAVAAALLLALSRLVGAANMMRVHLAAAVAAALFFSFPQVMELFEGVIRAFDLATAPHYFYAATFLAAPALVLLTPNREIILKLAAGFSATVVTVALIEFVLVRFGGDDRMRAAPPAPSRALSAPPTAAAPRPPPDAARPNVYHIVVDGYASATQLRAVLGFDNGAFVRALGERGFVLPEWAMANYPKTVLSLAALFNMDYPVLETDTYSSDVRFFDILGGRNALVRGYLRRHYRYLHVGASMWGGTQCAEAAEIVCLTPGPRPLSNRTLEAIAGVNAMTPLSYFVSVRSTRGGITTIDHVREIVAGNAGEPPYYLFAHTLPPHAPYIFKADCSAQPSVRLNLSGGLDETLYLASLRCVNRQLLAFADFIAERDPEAIVLIHSDHGSRFLTDWVQPIDSWSRRQFMERFSVFLAVKAPARCVASLYPGISLVNVSRFVAACVDGRAPDYVEDRHYVATDAQWSDYGHVFRYPYDGPGKTTGQ